MLVVKNDNGSVVAMQASIASVTLENDYTVFKFVGNVDGRVMEFRVPTAMGLVSEDYVKYMERIFFYFHDTTDEDVFAYNTLANIVADSANYATK